MLELAADVVWFDALVTNVDRTPRNPNLLVWHGRLWLIDHGAAFFRQHGDRPLADTLFSTGITSSYHQSLFLDRMQLRAALGLYRTDGGPFDSTVASGLVGLRYNF